MPSTKSKTTPEYNWFFDALGTKWEITSNQAISSATKQKITGEIERFDATYSRFRPDSQVRVIAKNPGTFMLPDSAETMLNFYDELWDLTNHKVTPLVGGTLEAAGYDGEYTLRPNNTIPLPPHYKDTVHRNGATISVDKAVLIDIGAVGKGYLVDSICELFKKDGHASFVVDASGDLRVVGERIEVVGLEHPDDTSEIIGTAAVSNRALCASASNRRSWGDWHHIIDPDTTRPVRDIVATWVIADSTMIADGLATALFFSSPADLAARYTYEYVRLHANGSVEYSNYFAKGMFS